MFTRRMSSTVLHRAPSSFGCAGPSRTPGDKATVLARAASGAPEAITVAQVGNATIADPRQEVGGVVAFSVPNAPPIIRPTEVTYKVGNDDCDEARSVPRLAGWSCANKGGEVRMADLAFTAPDHAAVDAFHAAALRHGGTDNGAPGLRPRYGPTYYAAFSVEPESAPSRSS